MIAEPLVESVTCPSTCGQGVLQEDHLPSTKDITNKDGDNGADEASNIVACNRDSLDGRDMIVVGMSRDIDFWKRFDKTAECEETSHYTLIISEEEEVDTWYDVSG
jgi:hypothetical protein